MTEDFDRNAPTDDEWAMHGTDSGEYYDPDKLYGGVMVPHWILERPELSAEAKLLYAISRAQLAEEKPDTGLLEMKVEDLKALGFSLEHITTALKDLQESKLLELVERAHGVIKFGLLRHEWSNPIVTKEVA